MSRVVYLPGASFHLNCLLKPSLEGAGKLTVLSELFPCHCEVLSSVKELTTDEETTVLKSLAFTILYIRAKIIDFS